MLRIWRHFGPRVQLLLQLHDAIYFQYDETDNEKEIVSTALSLMHMNLEHKGRLFSVPGEAKVGWNLAKFDAKKNPRGLQKAKLHG